MAEEKRVLCIGISGPSSSGKSLLTSHLSQVIPNTITIHQDDFYKVDIPIHPHKGEQHWDVPTSIRWEDFISAIETTKHNPVQLDSKDATNGSLSNERLDETRALLIKEGWNASTILIIVEGFLLFGSLDSDPYVSSSLQSTSSPTRERLLSLFDEMIFLTAPYSILKARRESRSGYIIEGGGWWKDPPGYFDEYVWPAYSNLHSYLFVDGDVSGIMKESSQTSELRRLHQISGEASPDQVSSQVLALLKNMKR
ncbi:nicotinamide riboside kinase [Planoprotostelium fungivorum]|uniref:Nicotinamide riboside kinase n=1 Tax=Planoprotostelium fungivorum TaxID=1890364 RepID=A0A2P6NX27_9EUKA|nr:nicotinamide riboside kinase [Planoprotostelium fungivorum]